VELANNGRLDVKTKLKETIFLVEATSNEWHVLWSRWCKESKECWEPVIKKWEQLGGWLLTIGHLEDRPVCVSLTFDRLDGFLVCSWEATSEVVDYKMINEWFDKHYSSVTRDGRRARCNFANFHHCTYEIADLLESGELNAT